MRKTLLSLTLIIFVVSGIFSQQLIFDDFESYTAGNGIAEEAGDPWTTWSNAPGGAEDPVVSTDFAYSGVNSVHVTNNNDGILNLGGKETRRYRINFRMYVLAGNTGYFNVLQIFDGANTAWGMQTFFLTDGTGSVDAGGGDAAFFEFSHDTWLLVKIYVDVDNDFATLLIDNEELVSWQWSSGAFGANNNLILDAVNFYGWTQEGASSYYFDDVEFTELAALSAPLNLTASLVEDDVTLTWNEPVDGTPEFYAVIRNDEVIVSGLTEMTYFDEHLYPSEYEYVVRAFYADLGYTPASNEATIVLEGGIPRQLVLFEIGTGTWCGFCPGAAMGADDLIDSDRPAAIIEYHFGDDYENTYSTERLTYYGITGFPTTYIDGTFSIAGGSQTESMYTQYDLALSDRMNVDALYTIDLEPSVNEQGVYTVNATVNKSYDYFDGSVKLHAAITESHVEVSWFGLDEVNYRCLEMMPDANGTTIDFTTNDEVVVEYVFEVDPLSYLSTEDYEFVIFLQHESSKEVLQAAKVNIGDIELPAVYYEATFNVNMNDAEDFDPLVDSIFIAGSMAGWAEPGTTDSLMLTDDDSDLIYSISFSLEDGEYQYKYFKNSGWGGGEWEDDPDRTVVIDGDMTINNIWGDPTDNIEIIDLKEVVKIYPNPAQKQINISSLQNSTVNIYSLAGQLVLSSTSANPSQSIDISNLSKGFYIIRVETPAGKIVDKLIIE